MIVYIAQTKQFILVEMSKVIDKNVNSYPHFVDLKMMEKWSYSRSYPHYPHFLPVFYTKTNLSTRKFVLCKKIKIEKVKKNLDRQIV